MLTWFPGDSNTKYGHPWLTGHMSGISNVRMSNANAVGGYEYRFH